jgi:dsDNA-binding SOS-regulon protein
MGLTKPNSNLVHISYDENDMHDKMLLLADKFMEANLIPIFYMDDKSNNTYILRFEKAEHGFH